MNFKDIKYLKGKEALIAEFFMLLILIILSVPFIIFFSLKYFHLFVSKTITKIFTLPITEPNTA